MCHLSEAMMKQLSSSQCHFMEISFLKKGQGIHSGSTKMVTMHTTDSSDWKQFADWHAKLNLYIGLYLALTYRGTPKIKRALVSSDLSFNLLIDLGLVFP